MPDNAKVGRRNRRLAETIVKRDCYHGHDRLLRDLGDVVTAYEVARRLQPLNGCTPYDLISKTRTAEPGWVDIDSIRHLPILNT